MTQYHAPQGGLPSQTTLHTGRAIFTNSYAVIPKGCFSDIVTSLIPAWENTKLWLIARPLSVLQAHPDLAGKLAAAKSLTPDSTSEQASAALDALTDAERTTFQSLNSAYMAKHGFPFIIAVRDHTKASILQAFEARIANDTEAEFQTACGQVERIAELRLKDILP